MGPINSHAFFTTHYQMIWFADSKVHGANMGLSAPDGSHVGPMNLVIRVVVFAVAGLWRKTMNWFSWNTRNRLEDVPDHHLNTGYFNIFEQPGLDDFRFLKKGVSEVCALAAWCVNSVTCSISFIWVFMLMFTITVISRLEHSAYIIVLFFVIWILLFSCGNK